VASSRKTPLMEFTTTKPLADTLSVGRTTRLAARSTGYDDVPVTRAECCKVPRSMIPYLPAIVLMRIWGGNLSKRVGPLQKSPIPSQTLLCTIPIRFQYIPQPTREPGTGTRGSAQSAVQTGIIHQSSCQRFQVASPQNNPHPALRRTSEFSKERGFRNLPTSRHSARSRFYRRIHQCFLLPCTRATAHTQSHSLAP
jgi:hypothetical protein